MKRLQHYRISSACVGVLVATLASIPGARADEFDSAMGLAQTFYAEYESLRQFTPREVRELVKAVCDAEEDDQVSVAASVSARVKDRVNDEYQKLGRRRSDALAALDKVLDDERFKEKRSEARDWKAKVEEAWRRIGRMTERVRGGSNPVVSKMREIGQRAHAAYQKSSSNCTVDEYVLPSGRADCLKANGSSCQVIEVKPNNSRSISKGNDQARRYVNDLKNESVLKELISRAPAFGQCKEFEPRVARYSACPDIDDEGNIRSLSVGWD